MKKFLAILLLALLAFSGCSFFEKETKNEQPTEVNADTILDNQIFTEAVGSGDIVKCDKILDKTKKEECKNVLESDSLTAKAIAELDKSSCKKIEMERYRDYCEEIVDAKSAEKEEGEKAAEKAKEQEALRVKTEQEAQDKGNASICEQIETKADMYSCKYNVISNKAIDENDPTLCENIEELSLVEACKLLF